MMSNSIVSGNVIMIDGGKISASTKPKVQTIPNQRNKTVALNPNSERDNTVGIDNVAEGSVAVGYLAKSSGGSSVAVGYDPAPTAFALYPYDIDPSLVDSFSLPKASECALNTLAFSPTANPWLAFSSTNAYLPIAVEPSANAKDNTPIAID